MLGFFLDALASHFIFLKKSIGNFFIVHIYFLGVCAKKNVILDLTWSWQQGKRQHNCLFSGRTLPDWDPNLSANRVWDHYFKCGIYTKSGAAVYKDKGTKLVQSTVFPVF